MQFTAGIDRIKVGKDSLVRRLHFMQHNHHRIQRRHTRRLMGSRGSPGTIGSIKNIRNSNCQCHGAVVCIEFGNDGLAGMKWGSISGWGGEQRDLIKQRL